MSGNPQGAGTPWPKGQGMEPTSASLLTVAANLRLRLSSLEESRQLQRAAGILLEKTERQLVLARRDLRATLLEASRLSRDEGQADQALELAREYAEQDWLVQSAEARLEALEARRGEA